MPEKEMRGGSSSAILKLGLIVCLSSIGLSYVGEVSKKGPPMIMSKRTWQEVVLEYPRCRL